MSYVFSLNKLSLTEFNITHANYVRHAVHNEMANPRIIDEIYTHVYDVNAPYFVATDTKSGETETMNTVQLAQAHQNYDLIDQLRDMGLIRAEKQHTTTPFFKTPAVS